MDPIQALHIQDHLPIKKIVHRHRRSQPISVPAPRLQDHPNLGGQRGSLAGSALNNPPMSKPARWALNCDDVVMQGFSNDQRELLDAQSVTGHLLPRPGAAGSGRTIGTPRTERRRRRRRCESRRNRCGEARGSAAGLRLGRREPEEEGSHCPTRLSLGDHGRHHARIKNSSNAPETSNSTDPGPRRLSGARHLAGEDGWWVAQRGHVTVLCARLPPALLAGGHDYQLVRQAASALGVL